MRGGGLSEGVEMFLEVVEIFSEGLLSFFGGIQRFFKGGGGRCFRGD